jgi:signal transduction histidine kinase
VRTDPGRHRRAPGPGGPERLLEQVVRLATDGDGADPAELAAVIGQGLGARRCRLETWTGDARTLHAWPPGDPGPWPDGGVPVRYGGHQVGVLGVELPALDRVAGRHRGLLRDLAAVLGPVLHAAATRDRIAARTAAAEAAATELGALRAGSVAEQEDARRALERDLHDGAQHHLVTLRLTAGLLDHELAGGDVAAARERLRTLEDLLAVTEAGLAATAAGVLPEALVTQGLLAAFEVELRTAPAVRVEADAAVRGRRYPVPVEVAVFYACLEAVNNAHKHAPGAAVTVALRHTYQGLAFEVSDDGPGFDPAATGAGSGLPRLADRLAAAGGELHVRSAPGTGTTISGLVRV